MGVSREEMQQWFVGVLKDEIGVSDVKLTGITSGSKLQDDLGLDSLDAVTLAVAIEDKFNVQLPDADMKKLTTVGEAFALIGGLLARKEAELVP